MSPSPPLLRLVRTRDAEFEEAFRAVEQRRLAAKEEVESVVATIVEDVRQRGDDAVLDAIERYDGYRLTSSELVVTEGEIAAAASERRKDRFFLSQCIWRISVRPTM